MDCSLTLRSVNDSDCRLLWEWANDPLVRQQSFNSTPIPWEDHVSWFARKLEDPNCHHFIGLNGAGQPVGQVRFDVGCEAEVDVSVDAGCRGYGYGFRLLKLTSVVLFNCTPVNRINAYVWPQNVASLRSFTKAGYRSLGQDVVHEQEVIHLVLERKDAKVS